MHSRNLLIFGLSGEVTGQAFCFPFLQRSGTSPLWIANACQTILPANSLD
jgi:hypothetical protein